MKCKRCQGEVRRAQGIEVFLAFPLAYLTGLRKRAYYVHKSKRGPYYGQFRCPKRFLSLDEVED